MMELMEEETSILEPGSIVLKDQRKWKDSLGIKDFLAATHRSSLRELKKVSLYLILVLRLLKFINSMISYLASRLECV